MKRLLLVPMLFLVFIFTSCDKDIIKIGAVPPAVPIYFSSDVLITRKDSEIKAQLERNMNGITVFDIISPESLNGISLTFDGSDCTVALGESMSFDFNYSDISRESVFKVISKSLKRISEDMNLSVERSGEDWIYTLYDENSDAVTVIQDGSTGFFKSMSVPSQDFSVTFSNFAELTEGSSSAK